MFGGETKYIETFGTSHNRTVYASPPVGGSGYGFARSVGLRPRSHAKPPPQFVGPGNATHFLIRAAKPSYTAGTLCAMWAKMVVIY
jgi:hypothetical protein